MQYDATFFMKNFYKKIYLTHRRNIDHSLHLFAPFPDKFAKLISSILLNFYIRNCES